MEDCLEMDRKKIKREEGKGKEDWGLVPCRGGGGDLSVLGSVHRLKSSCMYD